MERSILEAMRKNRHEHELVREIIQAEWKTAFSPLGAVVAQLLDDFYTRDEAAESCPVEVLLNRGREKFANSKHSELFADFVSGFDGSGSVPNLIHDLRQSRRNRIGDELASLFANREAPDKIYPLIDAYKGLDDEDSQGEDSDDVYQGIPIGDLLDRSFTGGATLSLGLRSLDQACDGGARAGHHILVFARPEIGKTLFAIDLVAGFLQQGARVLYVGNEDPLSDITLRVIQRLTRRTRDQVRADRTGTQALLEARNYGLFVGLSASPGTLPWIDRHVEIFEPRVVVLDQLRNINVGDDNRVTALEKAAIGARNLAKSRGVIVVSLTQAGESAEGKSFLELSDIDFSKTGIPGAVDLAIAIGASQEDKRFGVRNIHLPKNKLGGNHVQFSTRFDTGTGVVEEFD